MKQAITCLALVFASVSLALGQTTFGSISGLVSDPTHALVPGAQVTLTNTGTGATQTTMTSSDGTYGFVNLPPGNYRIDVASSGFKHFTRSPVVVETQQAYRIDITMELGSLTQTVEVKAATPLLQPETSSLGQVIAGNAVTEMPLDGRNVFNLMALVPSVVPQGGALGTPVGKNNFARGNLQINGAFGNQSAEYLDGVPLNNGFVNLPIFIPTQDSIQEFKVQTNNLGPEWGRFAGGVMNLTTKSGANLVHGEAYEFLRNKVLNANDFFSNEAGIPTPPFTQNQFGANAGGPVYIPGLYDGRDKMFWFFGWEAFRLRQGSTFVETVPSAEERTGNFSNYLDANGNLIPIYNPLTVCGELGNPACAVGSDGQPIYSRQQFGGNIISPAAMINATSNKLQSLWPMPNAVGQAFTNVNNWVGQASTSYK